MQRAHGIFGRAWQALSKDMVLEAIESWQSLSVAAWRMALVLELIHFSLGPFGPLEALTPMNRYTLYDPRGRGWSRSASSVLPRTRACLMVCMDYVRASQVTMNPEKTMVQFMVPV